MATIRIAQMGQQGLIPNHQPLTPTSPNVAPTWEVLITRDDNSVAKYVFGQNQNDVGIVAIKPASWLGAQGYTSSLVSTFSSILDSRDAALLGSNGTNVTYDARFPAVRNLGSGFQIAPEYSTSNGWNASQPSGSISVLTTVGVNNTPTPVNTGGGTPTTGGGGGVITTGGGDPILPILTSAATLGEQIQKFLKDFWWLLLIIAVLIYLYMQSQGRGSRRRKRSIF